MLIIIIGSTVVACFALLLTVRAFSKADKRDAINYTALVTSNKATELELAIRYVASIPGTNSERRMEGNSKAAYQSDIDNMNDQRERMAILAAAAKDIK